MKINTASKSLVLQGIFVFLVYLSLSFLLFASTWVSPFDQWIGFQGDPNTFMWGLGWVPYAITHGHSLFFTHYLIYPRGENLMWTTSVLGPALFLSPITLLFGVVFSYNLMVTLGLAISAFFAYLALKTFDFLLLPSIIGGILFGFSPYMTAQALGHINLTINWYPPAVIVFLNWFLFKNNKNKWLAILFGILSFFQLMTGEELFASTVLSSIIFLVILAALFPSRIIPTLKNSWSSLSLVVVTIALLSMYPLYVQFFGHQAIKGPAQSYNVYVTDLANLITPTHIMLLAPQWALKISNNFTGNLTEWNGYIGIPLIIVFLLTTIFLWSKPVVRVAFIFSIIMTILSMGPQLHWIGKSENIFLPWSFIQNIPVVGSILPNRLMNYVFLGVTFVFVAGLNEVVSKNKLGFLYMLIIAIFCLSPLIPLYPYPSTKKVLPSFFISSDIKSIPKKSIALIMPSAPFATLPAFWQAEAKFRFKMPEGPSAIPFEPSGIGIGPYGAIPSYLNNELFDIQMGKSKIKINNQSLIRMRKDLKLNSIQTVIIGPFGIGQHRLPSTNYHVFSHPSGTSLTIQEEQTKELFTLILKRKPQYVGGVYMWKVNNKKL